jgi:hypothetical protein
MGMKLDKGLNLCNILLFHISLWKYNISQESIYLSHHHIYLMHFKVELKPETKYTYKGC